MQYIENKSFDVSMVLIRPEDGLIGKILKPVRQLQDPYLMARPKTRWILGNMLIILQPCVSIYGSLRKLTALKSVETASRC